MIGKAHKLGDDINTDYIIPSRRRIRASSIEAMVPYLLEDLVPDLHTSLESGDFLVAGHNFGSGSSRETAPRLIQVAGLAAVLAKSFARIFYRNAISVGLPPIICDTDLVCDGDKLDIDLRAGVISNRTQGCEIQISPFPAFMWKILESGGLVEFFRRYGSFESGM
jgi:3-isopropylmalate/(R)-2-methylmalate dehydratase small subunit